MSEFWNTVWTVLLSICAFLALAADNFGAAGKLEHNVSNRLINNTALKKDNQRPMSVLLVAFSDHSHITQMSSIGGALVRRGHNVTLCTTEREGSDFPNQVTKQLGMTFLSAGPDVLPTVRAKLDDTATYQHIAPIFYFYLHNKNIEVANIEVYTFPYHLATTPATIPQKYYIVFPRN